MPIGAFTGSLSLSLSSGNVRSETKSASPRSSTAGATDDGHASAPSSLETPANGTEDTADKTQKQQQQQQQPQAAASATVAASPAAATDEKLIPAGKKNVRNARMSLQQRQRRHKEQMCRRHKQQPIR